MSIADDRGGARGKPDFGDVRAGTEPSAARKPGAPDFSNVRSGSSSTAEGERVEQEVRTYVVAKGDTLSKIAQREYGDANKWKQIFEANSETIKNPDLIYPGQTLRLP
jgi:nucleoid-associated protein YgaU